MYSAAVGANLSGVGFPCSGGEARDLYCRDVGVLSFGSYYTQHTAVYSGLKHLLCSVAFEDRCFVAAVSS